MSENTYRVIEVVGTSTTDVSDAMRNGIARAAETMTDLDWFTVTETRGHIEDGQIAHFQVTMKIGFKLT